MHAAKSTAGRNVTLINPAVLHNHTKSSQTSLRTIVCFLPGCAGSLPATPLRYAKSSNTVIFNLRSSRPPSSRLRKRLLCPHRIHTHPRTRYGGRSRYPTTSPRKPCPNPGTSRQPMANALAHQSNAHKAKAKRAAWSCQEASQTAQCIHPLSQR